MNRETLKKQCKKAMMFLFTIFKFALLFFCLKEVVIITFFNLSDIETYYFYYENFHDSWQILLFTIYCSLLLIAATYFAFRKKYIFLFAVTLITNYTTTRSFEYIPDMIYVHNVAKCIDEPLEPMCENVVTNERDKKKLKKLQQ